MASLKELIQQAKDNKISWNTKVRLKSKVEIKKSLEKLPPKNWNKIRHVLPSWPLQVRTERLTNFPFFSLTSNLSSLTGSLLGESLIKWIEESDRLIKKNSKKFVSGEILGKFKEYVDNDLELETNERIKKIGGINENDIIIDSWNNIANIFEKSDKIYGRNGDRHAFQSKEAFLFLRSIINKDFLSTIEYKKGEIFKLKEWENDNRDELDVEVKKMINVWESLHEDFSEDERQKLEELDISGENITGVLNLREFPNLKILDCSHNYLSSLILNKNNTNLVYLNCSHNKLRTRLDLTNNQKLTHLDCSFNKLEELVISEHSNLETFVCNDNKLGNDLKNLLDNLSSNRLTGLNISNNNFPLQNITIFSPFTNLKSLWIGNEDESKIKKEEIYNKFYGSLESLEDMTKLESLHISNTDIDGYSDRLPSDIEIHYSTKERPNSKLKEIKEQLRGKYKNCSSQLTKLKEKLEVLKEKIGEVEEALALIEIPFNS